MRESWVAGLEAFIGATEGRSVAVTDLAPVSSVGNAREPWSFTARWDGTAVDCVMLVKAAAGQLDTELQPEFATIRALGGSRVPVPGALWIDALGRAFGAPFFVTERVPGTADTRVLRRSDGDPAIRSVALELAAAAARLHAVDPAGPAFAHLPRVSPADVAATQLAHWEAQFHRHRLEPHPALVYAIAWLRRRLPVAHRVSVVHGDLRFGNLLYEGGSLRALLDWEMSHLGDPVEDLGWVYRRLWSPAASLPWNAFLDAYVAAGGERPDPEHLRWYQVFAEVKHSVISLTATASFASGAATSVRHADRAATVPPFVTTLLDLVEGSC